MREDWHDLPSAPGVHAGRILITTAVLAAFFAPTPAPFLLAAMSLAGVAAVLVDRFNPDALHWRITGGLTLYALAALAHLGYQAYLAGVDATA